MKKYISLSILALFVIINIISASPFIKAKIFNITHPDWIQINSFKILKKDVVCSRFSRGSDSFSKIIVIYEYFMGSERYVSRDDNVITIYRINVFDTCENLKYEILNFWDTYDKKNKIQLWVNKNNITESKILMVDKNISLRLSKMSFYISEIQGFIGGLIMILISIIIYIGIKKFKE